MRYRRPVRFADLLACGIQVQTLWYRAPEILWGAVGWGTAVDVWSLGVTVAELSGHLVHERAKSEVDLMSAWWKKRGVPTTAELTSLPHFPAAPPALRAPPWPLCVRACLGYRGGEFLDELLAWAPSARPRAAAALGHGYLHPERAAAGGTVVPPEGGPAPPTQHEHTGNRHVWRALSMELSPELLALLRGDDAFTAGTAAHAALALSFTPRPPKKKKKKPPKKTRARSARAASSHGGFKSRQRRVTAASRHGGGDGRPLPASLIALGCGKLRGDAKVEQGRKCVVGGWVSPTRSKNMCTLDVSKPFPVPRVTAFLGAFYEANAATVGGMIAQAQAMCSVGGLGKIGLNGKAFMKMSPREAFLSLAELHVSNGADPALDLWDETRHQDGGASVIHASLTLWGLRGVRCEQRPPAPDVVLKCRPGTFYVATPAPSHAPRSGGEWSGGERSGGSGGERFTT